MSWSKRLSGYELRQEQFTNWYKGFQRFTGLTPASSITGPESILHPLFAVEGVGSVSSQTPSKTRRNPDGTQLGGGFLAQLQGDTPFCPEAQGPAAPLKIDLGL